MTKSKLILGTSIGALIFGLAGFAATSLGCRDVLAKDIVVAADDDTQGEDEANSNGAAKMDEDTGTDAGDEQGATPEDDTKSNAPGAEDDEGGPPKEGEDNEEPE